MIYEKRWPHCLELYESLAALFCVKGCRKNVKTKKLKINAQQPRAQGGQLKRFCSEVILCSGNASEDLSVCYASNALSCRQRCSLVCLPDTLGLVQLLVSILIVLLKMEKLHLMSKVWTMYTIRKKVFVHFAFDSVLDVPSVRTVESIVFFAFDFSCTRWRHRSPPEARRDVAREPLNSIADS